MLTHDIVVIRLDAIGDFILWLDAARQLRDLYIGRRITLVANSDWAPLASQMRYFDEVIPVSPQLYRGHRSLARQLCRDFFRFRRWSADRVIHPVISRSLHSNLIAKWIRSPIKQAPVGDNNNLQSRIHLIPGFRSEDTLGWYTHLIPTGRSDMELQANAQFMSGILDCEQLNQLPNLRDALVISAPQMALPEGYVVVVPGASDPRKAWSVDRFAAVIQPWPITIPLVICGASSEVPITSSLEAQLSSSGRKIINLGGQTQLIDLVSVIAGARGVLGNDSAAIHIASAVQVPSVAIVGGGHFGRFVPYQLGPNWVMPTYVPKVVAFPMPCYGCNWRCSVGVPGMVKWPCIDGVSIQQVSRHVTQSC
jgi:ADP-heptose:LPS heptosyltransferase